MPILICIDAPDPDNFALVKGVKVLFPDEDVKVMLTGRPVRFKAKKDCQLWEWDYESSRMAQEASAARLKNFMRNLGVSVCEVYDGGSLRALSSLTGFISRNIISSWTLIRLPRCAIRSCRPSKI